MHRWHFQKIIRPLLPILLMLIMLCALVARQKSNGVGRSFTHDEAYRNLAYARTLCEHGIYGLTPEHTRPATYDVAWRMMLGVFSCVLRDPVSTIYLAGAVFGVITILIFIRLARLLFPFPPFILFASVLLVISPGFLSSLISGTAVPAATCLVTAAVLFHIEGLMGRRRVLPMSAAVMIGLAMWIRMEFIIVWIVFTLHACLMARFSPVQSTVPDEDDEDAIAFYQQDHHAALVFMRGFAGFLLLALFLLPLVTWNVIWIRVPWPRMMGTPMALDVWSRIPVLEALQRSMDASWSALPALYAGIFRIPCLAWGAEKLFFWFGVLVLATLVVWRREERPFTLVIAIPLLLPALYALIYPYTGTTSVPVVYRTFAPPAVLMMAFGFYRVPILLEGIYRRYKEGLPAAIGFRLWWTVSGIIVLLVCLTHFVVTARERGRELEQLSVVRRDLSTELNRLQMDESSLLTDVPGWVAYTRPVDVIDMGTESEPDILACLGQHGVPDPYKIQRLMDTRRPDYILRWTPESAYIENLLRGPLLYPAANSRQDADALPRLRRISWSGGI